MASNMATNPVGGTGKRPKADWNEKNYEIFLKCCIEQVRAGNRPHAHFNKQGWTNVINSFNEQTGLSYEYKQMKNKWDILRKEWSAWAKLIGKETGVGWDNSRQTIAASEEWWEAKIKVHAEVAKFRKEGPKCLAEMEILFKDTVATGNVQFAPSQDPEEEAGNNMNNDMTEERGLEDIEEEDEPNLVITSDPSLTSSGSKRKRVGRDNKKGAVGHRMCDQFDRIIESIGGAKQGGPTLAECLEMLKNLSGLEYGSDTHVLGVRLLNKPSNKETFVLLKDPFLQLN